ncbi:hypothetical protein ACFLS1_11850 [Verrucomicrobiota bacterium]
MKCREIEQKILLAESGELSDRESEKLVSHLSDCRHCEQYRQIARRIVAAAREKLPDGNLEPNVMKAIRVAANKETMERAEGFTSQGVILWFRRPSIRILACAAALVLIACGLFVLSPTNGASGRISNLNAILVMVSEEDDSSALQYPEVTGSESQLKMLANQLLAIEGFATDESIGADFL